MKKRIDATLYDLDKARNIGLLDSYEECFEHLIDSEIKLLELGVLNGGSLLLWRDYFAKGIIVRMDRNHVSIDDPSGRIYFIQGEQQDTGLLDRIAQEYAPDGFDVIIDDCSHIGRLARISFWHLFENHLKPGGIYVIEDWGTGYMDDWPDGKGFRLPIDGTFYWLSSRKDHLLASTERWLSSFSPRLAKMCMSISMSTKTPGHKYGMAGFVKELIDACHFGEAASPSRCNGRWRSYGIHRMHFFWNHVIVFKSCETGTCLDSGDAAVV